jgi:hypothetical protein
MHAMLRAGTEFRIGLCPATTRQEAESAPKTSDARGGARRRRGAIDCDPQPAYPIKCRTSTQRSRHPKSAEIRKELPPLIHQRTVSANSGNARAIWRTGEVGARRSLQTAAVDTYAMVERRVAARPRGPAFVQACSANVAIRDGFGSGCDPGRDTQSRPALDCWADGGTVCPPL